MDPKIKNKSNRTIENDKGETTRMAKDQSRPVKLAMMVLNSVLVVVTDLWAGLLGSAVFRRHFHLLLSGVVLFGPAMSLWVSKYSIFANRNHYLYRWGLSFDNAHQFKGKPLFMSMKWALPWYRILERVDKSSVLSKLCYCWFVIMNVLMFSWFHT